MNLIRWAKRHYWDSLEKDKDLIIRHLRTFSDEDDEEGIREELQLADKNYLDLKNTFDDRVAAAKREEKERIINEMEEANELNGEPWGEHYHYAYGYDPVEEGSLIIEKDKWQALKEGK